MRNKKMAAAVIGQAIVDEGYLGTDTIVIRYHSRDNTKAIWNIANKWGWANRLQFHKYVDNRKPTEIKNAWRFSIKRKAIPQIYDYIGALPDRKRDLKMQTIMRLNGSTGKTKGIGVVKSEIMQEMGKSPQTVETLVKKFDMSASSIQKHLRELTSQNKIEIRQVNGYGKLEYNVKSL